jgi:hypothetical protein
MSDRCGERRAHQRISLSLPVTIRRPEHSADARTVTTDDIGPGGIRFETNETDLRVGESIGVRLTIPRAMGYLPNETRATADACIVRVHPDPSGSNEQPVTVHVAAKFSHPIRLDW